MPLNGLVISFLALVTCATTQSPQDRCTLPRKPGNGAANVLRFYFNKGQCKQFTYKGNAGNANNFESWLDCSAACACPLPLHEGKGGGRLTRYFFNNETKQCRAFTFKGKNKNANNFLSTTECERACVCTLPVEWGSCQESLDRFFYNGTSRTCEPFRYTGCGGNVNNFLTITDCQASCEC